jgi:hypothetical protein
MRRATVPVALFTLLASRAPAEEPGDMRPFKLGTFEHQGRTFVGLVRGDSSVIDVAVANAALEKGHPAWPRLKAPADMRDLIARYDELRERLHAIAKETAAGPSVQALTALKLRPPSWPPRRC